MAASASIEQCLVKIMSMSGCMNDTTYAEWVSLPRHGSTAPEAEAST